MKAILLAAGMGTRLRPITDKVPKCMVPVCGIPIIEKQINNLHDNHVDEIFIVAGYKMDVLKQFLKEKYPSVQIVENTLFESTNNMFSLFLCLQQMKEGAFLLMNSDVFFDSNIISGLLSSESENMIACEKGRFIEESMKITTNSQNIVTHISKGIDKKEAFATSIDVYKIGVSARSCLFRKISDIILNENNRNSWTEVALDSIFEEVIFYPYNIQGKWLEIDNHDDLVAAENLFK